MREIIEHLERDYTNPIRDPVWKHIYLSDALLHLASAPAFQELNHIKQLGPAYLVYPGATHTRLSHSLGTYHLAKRMIHSLLRKADGASGFELEEVQAFLCAALLHDLGHYPLAHALKNLEVERHEALTGRLIMEKPLSDTISSGMGIDPRLVAAIVDTELEYAGSAHLTFFRRLLSGVLDPDKLDYLNRDAYYCGVPYGIQDVDFFLSEIVPCRDEEIALSMKGVTSVEAVLFSKYLMYKTVYWHKAVRTATAMIKKALVLGLREGVLRKEDLYGLTDQAFFSMVEGKNFRPFSLIKDAGQRRLYKRVWRVPFDPGNAFHNKLENLDYRQKYEAGLAREAGRLAGREVREEEVVIDIPESISFEIDLTIYDEETSVFFPFKESGAIFSERIVDGFARSLRFISLVCARDEDLVRALKKIGLKPDA
jgi:HD superfamily phosphohydrolase